MHKITLPHYLTEHVNGVTVFRILVKEVRDPDTAVAVFRGVSAMARRTVPAFILIDLSQTKHMSGMALVVLSSLAQQVSATRGRLAICRLDATLRVGADDHGPQLGPGHLRRRGVRARLVLTAFGLTSGPSASGSGRPLRRGGWIPEPPSRLSRVGGTGTTAEPARGGTGRRDRHRRRGSDRGRTHRTDERSDDR